jgi:hypothetical protein
MSVGTISMTGAINMVANGLPEGLEGNTTTHNRLLASGAGRATQHGN